MFSYFIKRGGLMFYSFLHVCTATGWLTVQLTHFHEICYCQLSLHLHTCTPAHLHTCIHAHLHTCTPAHLHTCTHAHMHTCTPAYLHTCTPAHMHACTHAHIHTYIHAHLHTCTPAHLHTGRSLTGNTIPDAVLIQFDLLMMSTILLETCRGL
jgi:hypothetical protein